MSNQHDEWQDGFVALLPEIRKQLRFGFRGLPFGERSEAMAEAIASVTVAYHRLFKQGKLDVAFPTTLAGYAVRHYFAGRRVGDALNVNDVTSPYAQRQRGFYVKSLDQRNPAGEWKEILVEGRHATPADIAGSRIDMAEWFNRLPSLKRRIAETLATGETTSETARRFKLTAGRISQIRRELDDSWSEFIGDI